MLKISRLADYGLLILHELASDPQRCFSASALAERTGITLPTVSKVLKLLHEACLIHSIRGPSGGYCLSKKPQEINLVDIIGAVDGAPALTECCQLNNNCVHDARCTMRSNWRFINNLIVKELKKFTLLDLSRPLVEEVDRV